MISTAIEALPLIWSFWTSKTRKAHFKTNLHHASPWEHADAIRSPSLCVTKSGRFKPKTKTSVDFHWSYVLCIRISWAKLHVGLPQWWFICSNLTRPGSCSLLWTLDVEMCLLPELCEPFMWPLIWGAFHWRSLGLLTIMTLSSTTAVTLGLPLLRWCWWESVSS